MSEENIPQEQGEAQEKPQKSLEERFQDQSAIFGKVVNQSNNFAKDLEEVKSVVKSLAEAIKTTKEQPAEEQQPEKPQKQRVSPPEPVANNGLTFNQMAEELAAMKAKAAKEAEVAKHSQMARSLEHHGVSQEASDMVAKMLMANLGESVEIDDSNGSPAVTVQYEESKIGVDDFAKMWLESDSGSVFKADSRKSPTPKASGRQAQAANTGSEMNMIEFSKHVANQFAPGANKQEARQNASAFKLKT